ncbi:MAG: DUF5672 family protein [Candidatus Falkowbacteria bacterium]
MKKKLDTVTLLGIDCVNLERLKIAMDICQKDFKFAAVKILTSLPSDDLENIVKIDPIKSTEEYSRFCIERLDEYVDTPHVLIVQYDGFILNSKAWNDEFLDYDYIGAPWLVADWSIKNFNFPSELLGQWVVGNGGFSLRSKKLLSMISELFRDNKFEKYDPEDAAICVYYRQLLEDNGIKFSPVDLAKKFCFEGQNIKNYHWDGQFGFHGLKWTDISKWSKENPEYKIDNPASKKSEAEKYL